MIQGMKGTVVPLADIQFFQAIDKAEPIPEQFIQDLTEAVGPLHYWYIVAPVNIVRESPGKIILPDSAVSNQKWTHGLGQVMVRGPAVYKGKTFVDLGLSPEDAPKVGDLVGYDPKTPKRLSFDGKELVAVPDHALFIKFDPKYAGRISYNFGF